MREEWTDGKGKRERERKRTIFLPILPEKGIRPAGMQITRERERERERWKISKCVTSQRKLRIDSEFAARAFGNASKRRVRVLSRSQFGLRQSTTIILHINDI